MPQSGNALLTVLALLMGLGGAVLAVLIVLEIVQIMRNVYLSVRDDWRYSHSNLVTPERQVAPSRDRETVERVIDYPEEEKR